MFRSRGGKVIISCRNGVQPDRELLGVGGAAVTGGGRRVTAAGGASVLHGQLQRMFQRAFPLKVILRHAAESVIQAPVSAERSDVAALCRVLFLDGGVEVEQA